MGGLCTCCRPQVPKDQDSSIKHHGSFLRRKTSISAAFSFETPAKAEAVPMLVSRNGPLPPILSTLDINTTTEEDLMTLPNIGRITAHNIVEYRKQIGRFRRVEDLVLVSGVGACKLEKLRKEIHVSTSTEVHVSRSSLSISDSSNNLLVNINSATVANLSDVEGISVEMANKIVEHRSVHGNFRHINDLVEPAGLIDTPTLLQIKGFLTTGRHSRNVSSASSKLRSTSYNNFIGIGPECLESNRAKVEQFASKRDGRPVVRMATWNLQQCSKEKVNNPGVREVVCATILENAIKIIAIQELEDKDALLQIVDEMNSPTLPNIQRLRNNSCSWECSTSPTAVGRSSEYSGFIWDAAAGIQLYNSALLEKPSEGREFARRPFLGYFKMENADVVIVSVNLKAVAPVGGEGDLKKLTNEIHNLPLLVEALHEQVPEVNDIIILGDFNLEPDESEFDILREKNFSSIVPATVPTNISTKNMKGSRCYDNFWLSQSAVQLHTSKYQVVRNGLTNPWIPDGWSWGGIVSDHCPVWAEFFIDSEAADKSIGGLRLNL